MRILSAAALTFLFLIPAIGLQSQEAESKTKKALKEKVKVDEDAFRDAKVDIYRKIGDVELKIFYFCPPDHKPSDRRPAIVFFFGGGWKNGDPKQFASQAAYLASRGMVALAADYRVASRQQVKAISCVEDAKAAVAWVRANAERLGIDSNRIAAGGGSAGGHLAAATAVVPGYEESSQVGKSVPNALVLFNPALVLAPVAGEPLPSDDKPLSELKERIGDDPQKISPFHHVKSGAPPTIIFHGKADTAVPYRTAELFEQAMKKSGNRCELVGFEGKGHGFFNLNRDGNDGYLKTIEAMDQFLVSLGYLSSKTR
jgi:acetyl esterase